MKKMNKFMMMIAAAAVLFFTSCSDDEVTPVPSIVEIAVGNDDFSVLVDLLTRADLVETLQGEGPFTVFAPTNAAFVDLLTELDYANVDSLVSGLGIEFVTTVLLNHVVSGAKVLSTSLTDGQVVSPAGGDSFTITLGTPVTITDANDRVSNITAVDINASNGVIHVISKVILPSLP
jgi:transforming growth factor-beta-induced protein